MLLVFTALPDFSLLFGKLPFKKLALPGGKIEFRFNLLQQLVAAPVRVLFKEFTEFLNSFFNFFSRKLSGEFGRHDKSPMRNSLQA